MYIDFQNINTLQKSKNKPFLAVANLADFQIKTWLGSDNLSIALRGPWPYIYTQNSLYTTPVVCVLNFRTLDLSRSPENKPFLSVANLADSQIKAWQGSDNLYIALRGPRPYIYTKNAL